MWNVRKLFFWNICSAPLWNIENILEHKWLFFLPLTACSYKFTIQQTHLIFFIQKWAALTNWTVRFGHDLMIWTDAVELKYTECNSRRQRALMKMALLLCHQYLQCPCVWPTVYLAWETPDTISTEINIQLSALCQALNAAPHLIMQPLTLFDWVQMNVPLGSYLCRICCCHGEGIPVCTCSNIHRCNCGKNGRTLSHRLTWTDTRWCLLKRENH